MPTRRHRTASRARSSSAPPRAPSTPSWPSRALQPGGWLQRHFHSFEEALYVLAGELLLELDGHAHRLVKGDFALIPVGTWHALGNAGIEPVRLLSVNTPLRLPPGRGRRDTFFASEPFDLAALDAVAARPPFGDPRLRWIGHYDGTPPQAEALALADPARGRRPAGRDTALVVYSGISVKMLVDRVFGAELLTMFTVDYEPGGAAQVHDHPFEETYFFLDGEIEAELDGQTRHDPRRRRRLLRRRRDPRVLQHRHRARALDRDPGAAAAGAALVPLGRPLEAIRGRSGLTMAADGSVVVIGGNRGIGREIARHYADAGDEVVITCTDAARAEEAAAEIGGSTRGIALDLTEPNDFATRCRPVGPVRYLVIAAIDRDDNRVSDYDIERAMHLVTLKLVGYTEVIHALLDRLADDSAIVVFGGLAKDRPYPGSTTVSTVNGGIVGLVRTLVGELAPMRVNAIHPGIVEDSPFWSGKNLDEFLSRTPTERLTAMADIVDAVRFLLENPAVNGIDLRVDGGWMTT